MTGRRTSDVVIAGGVRTPRGKGSARGALHGVPPVRLVAGLLDALAARGLPPGAADDVILGCATQTGDQGGNLARAATLLAGWDARVPGLMINRFCASGLEAVSLAAARVRAGDAALIVAGGVESVSRVPVFADGGPLYTDPAVAARAGSIHMGVAADLVATLDGVERAALDDYADRSRRKARVAPPPPSLVPVPGLLDHDELLDGAPDRAALDALPPLFADRPAEDAAVHAHYPAARPLRHLHTRGNSPQLADAAALVAIADRAAAERAGLVPRARILATASCAVDPVIMLTAGQLAAQRALERAGLATREVAVFEVAEAFAALCLRFMRELDVDHDRLNPSGGTIALGHAFGATGAILALNAADELERRGERYGVAAVSGAAGLGTAIVIERA
jgi:acetyl-CoA C-acetyltransferase